MPKTLWNLNTVLCNNQRGQEIKRESGEADERLGGMEIMRRQYSCMKISKKFISSIFYLMVESYSS